MRHAATGDGAIARFHSNELENERLHLELLLPGSKRGKHSCCDGWDGRWRGQDDPEHDKTTKDIVYVNDFDQAKEECGCKERLECVRNRRRRRRRQRHVAVGWGMLGNSFSE